MTEVARSLLSIIITLVLSAILAFVYVEHQKSALMAQFRVLTQSQGAWSQDRDMIAEHIGLDPETLPSKRNQPR